MAFTSEVAKKAGKKSNRKGVPNKATSDIRKVFQSLIENNTDKIETWLDEIAEKDPVKAFDIIIKLSEYVIPKLNRTEIKDTTNIEDFLLLTPEERKQRIIALRKKIQHN